eukprot:4544178-Amphidinium_carterae.1
MAVVLGSSLFLQDLLQTNITPAVWDDRVILGLEEDVLLNVVSDIGVVPSERRHIHNLAFTSKTYNTDPLSGWSLQS